MQDCVGGAAGQRLGNYQLIRLLGHGGFAEVYLGEHVYLKTSAAIKVLEMQLANEALDSFLNEARTIARLEHPNIVRVLDFGMEGQTPFLVMNYAPNGTLRQRYPKGTILSPTSVIPYVQQIAAALQYAHDKKLVHRDIKPENMLLGANDDVLLSDFGLAIVAKSANSLHLQDKAGTIAYMAPEQLEGKPCPASDQYALGVVVYEWLSGNVPFHGLDLQVALQHVQLEPPALHEKVPTISLAIEHVVMKALTKDPTHRFPSVQDFAIAFERACSGELSASSTPTFSHQNVPASEGYHTPAAHHPFTPKPLDIPKHVSPRTPRPPRPLILPPGPLRTSKPSVLDYQATAAPIGSENATEDAGTGGPAESIPSPLKTLQTRPSPLPMLSVNSTTDGDNLPHPTPPRSRPYRKEGLFKQPFTRRKILTGLGGLAALGMAGGISWLAIFERPQALSSDSTGTPSSDSGSGSSAARTPLPNNQFTVTAHNDTPTSVTSSGPGPTSTPTLNPTPTSGVQPSPTPPPKLTIQMVNPPTEVINNSSVTVNVTASEAGVTVILHASYNVPPNGYNSGMQITDSHGNAALVWQVQVGKLKKDHTTATVTVSGVDQSGQQVQSASLAVNILPNNQSK